MVVFFFLRRLLLLSQDSFGNVLLLCKPKRETRIASGCVYPMGDPASIRRSKKDPLKVKDKWPVSARFIFWAYRPSLDLRLKVMESSDFPV